MIKANKITNLKVVKNKTKDSSKVSALSPREIVSELDRYVIGQLRKQLQLLLGTDGEGRLYLMR